jgi:L-rhamnose isomerase
VVIFDDETKEIAKEIVRNDALNRVFIATDYFDASINRISAWVTGMRSVQKALLNALLQPNEEMKKLQDENRMTELMVCQEEMKTAPLGDVWAEYLKREGVENDYISIVKEYEEKVLSKR